MVPLKDLRHTMESCNHCGQCKWVLGPKTKGYDYAEICPIHQRFGFDAYSGQGLLNIAEEILDGELEYESGLVELIYSCTTCGACDINCKSIRDMEVLETILALRARVVADGWGPMPAHQQAAGAVAAHHNIYGRAHEQRFGWLAPEVKLTKNCTTAYFAGCSAAYRYPQIAQDTAKILNAGGVEFTVLRAEEYCCGGPLWRTGQVEEARKVAEHNLAALSEARHRPGHHQLRGVLRGVPRFLSAAGSRELPRDAHYGSGAAIDRGAAVDASSPGKSQGHLSRPVSSRDVSRSRMCRGTGRFRRSDATSRRNSGARSPGRVRRAAGSVAGDSRGGDRGNGAQRGEFVLLRRRRRRGRGLSGVSVNGRPGSGAGKPGPPAPPRWFPAARFASPHWNRR